MTATTVTQLLVPLRRDAPCVAVRATACCFWLCRYRFWLLGIPGVLAVTACTIAFLLWGVYGPAYLLDLIAAYCGRDQLASRCWGFPRPRHHCAVDGSGEPSKLAAPWKPSC
jgi:hypothetical protein